MNAAAYEVNIRVRYSIKTLNKDIGIMKDDFHIP